MLRGVRSNHKLSGKYSDPLRREVESDVDVVALRPLRRQQNWAARVLRKRRDRTDLTAVYGDWLRLLVLHRHNTVGFLASRYLAKIATRWHECQIVYTSSAQPG